MRFLFHWNAFGAPAWFLARTPATPLAGVARMSPEEEAARRDAQQKVDEATRELARLTMAGAPAHALRDARDRLSRAEVALRLAPGARRKRS